MKKAVKVTLAAVNSKSSHSNPTLFYLKNILVEREDCSAELVELTINESWREALEKLCVLSSDYYLFSVYIWNRNWLVQLLPLLKRLRPEAKIILGGPEITWNSEFWSELNCADILVKGQAEGFADHLFTFDGPVFDSTRIAIDDSPFPYREQDRDLLEGRLVYYEASRGCLFNCSYCLSACVQGRPEYRNLENVKSNLEKLIALNPKIVKMVDRTFNSDREFARAVWRYLIERKSPVPFHFELHPLFLEEEDFSILSEAPEGLFFFEVGIQSTDKDVLTAVNRPWHRPKERENIEKLCRLKNVHTHLDQIVALPKDTPETAVRSFNEIISHNPDDFQLGFLKILPGTPLGNEAENRGLKYTPFPPYEIIETPDFPFGKLTDFYRTEADLNRFYNSGYFPHSLPAAMALFSSPWDFFRELSLHSPENRNTRQWAELATSLLKLAGPLIEGGVPYFTDLLRLDWSPRATGQNYPAPFRLESDNSIKDLRYHCYPLFEGLIDGFTGRDYKRSILYVPESSRMKEEREELILFYRRDGGKAEEWRLTEW